MSVGSGAAVGTAVDSSAGGAVGGCGDAVAGAAVAGAQAERIKAIGRMTAGIRILL